jgi:hypothetical protein
MDDVGVDWLAGSNCWRSDYVAVAASRGVAISVGDAEGGDASDAKASCAGGDNTESDFFVVVECGRAGCYAAIDRYAIARRRYGCE